MALALTVGGLAGCDEAPDAVQTPSPDYDAFELDVYPILVRDCGFLACHGRAARPFRLYGPGRLRAQPGGEPFAEATDEEIWRSYQRTRSMLTHGGDPLDAPLLTKPLPGGGHRGTDDFGRAVYEDEFDPSYQTLVLWARGELFYGEDSVSR